MNWWSGRETLCFLFKLAIILFVIASGAHNVGNIAVGLYK